MSFLRRSWVDTSRLLIELAMDNRLEASRRLIPGDANILEEAGVNSPMERRELDLWRILQADSPDNGVLVLSNDTDFRIRKDDLEEMADMGVANDDSWNNDDPRKSTDLLNVEDSGVSTASTQDFSGAPQSTESSTGLRIFLKCGSDRLDLMSCELLLLTTEVCNCSLDELLELDSRNSLIPGVLPVALFISYTLRGETSTRSITPLWDTPESWLQSNSDILCRRRGILRFISSRSSACCSLSQRRFFSISCIMISWNETC